MAHHWTAAELLPALRDCVHAGELDVDAAAARCHELEPGWLRPGLLQACQALQLLDNELHGMLYLSGEQRRTDDAQRLRAAWPMAKCAAKAGAASTAKAGADSAAAKAGAASTAKAGAAGAETQLDEPAGEESEPSDSDDSSSSSELSPSSTPEGVAAANALAAAQAAERARQTAARPRPGATAKRTARKKQRQAEAAEDALTAADAPTAAGSGGTRAAKARGRARRAAADADTAAAAASAGAATAKKRGRPSKEALKKEEARKARGAEAANASRGTCMQAWHDFRREQTPNFAHLGRKEALAAVGKAWREHQATVLGKPYGCPKCEFTGCNACGRWPPHKAARLTPAQG